MECVGFGPSFLYFGLFHQAFTAGDLAIFEYENYHEVSKDYDNTRVPVGVEIVLELLARSETPLEDQSVLDSGCGTGNYLLALAGSVGALHGIDLNTGMLSKAEEKTRAIENVFLKEGSVTNLPYEADSFDGILCNQVLHHVTDQDAALNDFAIVRQVVASAHESLRSDGALIFNISSHEQCRNGFWWADLIPHAIDAMVKRSPSLEMLREIMTDSGFGHIDSIVPVDAVLQGEDYFDAVGPLSQTWRDGDSTWSLVDEEELGSAIGRITALQADGDEDQYLRDQDESRKRIGQTTCLVGYKA